MNRMPTGRRERRSFGEAIVLERTFAAPIDDVWAAVTEPERPERWIGTWAGDPTSGQVAFRMTAEGADVPAVTVHIDDCAPPHLLRARIEVADPPGQEWRWELHLTHHAGVTTLRFVQAAAGDVPVSDVGPGWEYYLDRLVAAESGQDVASVDFERDYHPAMSGYYRDLFA